MNDQMWGHLVRLLCTRHLQDRLLALFGGRWSGVAAPSPAVEVRSVRGARARGRAPRARLTPAGRLQGPANDLLHQLAFVFSFYNSGGKRPGGPPVGTAEASCCFPERESAWGPVGLRGRPSPGSGQEQCSRRLSFPCRRQAPLRAPAGADGHQRPGEGSRRGGPAEIRECCPLASLPSLAAGVGGGRGPVAAACGTFIIRKEDLVTNSTHFKRGPKS